MAEKGPSFSAIFKKEDATMKRIIPFALAVLLLAGCHAPLQASSPVVTTARSVPATQVNVGNPTYQTEPQTITEEEAKAIALEHAGLNDGAIKSFSIELDLGDGVYEVEFYTKGMEYDYEIDAYTGKILQAEKDRD